MNNNQYPKAKYEAMRKGFREMAKKDPALALMLEKSDAARARKLRKRNHRKAMSVQQKRAAQGKVR